jgi:hypothetical protein
MKKITMATIKRFIKNNKENMYIKVRSEFDGREDSVIDSKSEFSPVKESTNMKDRQGIDGAWFVGGSKNYFTSYNGNGLTGYRVDNCCGSFVLAVKGA